MNPYQKSGVVLLLVGITLWPAVITFVLGIGWLRNDEVRIVNYSLCILMLTSGLVLIIGKKNIIKHYFKILLTGVYTLFLLFIADRIYGWMPKGLENSGSYQVYNKGDSFREDSILGFTAGENITRNSLSIAYPEGDTFYNVNYHTDSFGRRLTYGASDSMRKDHLIFFGCSYTFGWGVEDDETLPSALARSSDYKAYNYSFIAFGAQHMLAKLETNTLRKEIPEQKGTGIFVLILDHVNRAIGDMKTFNGLGKSMPYYNYDDNGKIVRKGNFTNRKWSNKIYRVLSYSQLVSGLGINIPSSIKLRHLNLTADIIARSKELYIQQFTNDSFYVLFYPAAVDFRPMLDSLKVLLESRGVHVIDYSELLGDDLNPYVLKPLIDSHPNDLSNRLVGQNLANDLSCILQ